MLRSKKNMDDNNGTSLFERLYHAGQVEIVTLLVQHRMPACIAGFPSQQYYHGKLQTARHDRSDPPKGFYWPSSDPICFIDEYGPGEKKDNNSLYNEQEAEAVVDAVYWLLKAGDVVPDDIVILAF